ncbi:histidine phosphatase family protein [Herbiconiux sp. P18]|uniref:histidine phosphatase family protein n=1 Tax=Herbiconiux liangxiaofengii TaxID=3342795 RepID=UPI0035B940BC
MRLLLIRHGQTIDNVKGELGTVVPGPGLTELGHRQAAAVPDALAGESIDAIVVSTMTRTQETAAPLAERLGLTPRILDGLQEISAGIFEGRGDKEAVSAYLRTLLSWWDDFDARLPGGESGADFVARYSGAIADAVSAHPEGTVAVFSHGAAIRTWASWFSQNIDASTSLALELHNTAVVVLEGSPETGWVCVEWAGEPLGGPALDDPGAPDPTADAV